MNSESDTVRDREQSQGSSPHFTFKIDGGVVLPSWLAALAGVIFLCAVLSLLVTVLVAGPRLAELGREVRLLQLDDQDVQNAVIRAGFAHRDDFAHLPATSSQPVPTIPAKKE